MVPVRLREPSLSQQDLQTIEKAAEAEQILAHLGLAEE